MTDRYLHDLASEIAQAAPPAPPFPRAGTPRRRTRHPALVTAAAFASVVIVAAIFYAVAGTGSDPLPPADAPSQSISFATDDGTVLRGTLWPGGETAVLLTGAYGAAPLELLPILEPLADRGLTVMTYDLRGQGRSGGPVDVPSAVGDVAAAIDYLIGTGISEVHLAGYLHSGTAAVMHAATEDPRIASLVLVFPLERYLQLDAIAAIGAVDVPVLLLGATPDLARAAPPQAEIFQVVGQPADFNVRGQEFANGIADFVVGIDR